MSDVISLMTNGQSTVKRIIHLLPVYITRRDCERYLYLVSPYNKLPRCSFFLTIKMEIKYREEKDQNVELTKKGDDEKKALLYL